MPKARIFALAAALALLCACSANGAASQVPPSADAPPAAEAASLRQCTASSGQGFYCIHPIFKDSASISYIDYAARQELFLCASPNCGHSDETCGSFLPLDASLACPDIFVAGGRLLTLQTGATETDPPHIDARELDGTRAERLVNFPENYFIYPARYIFTDDKSLYLLAQEQIAEETRLLYHIIQVDLASGKSRTLYTEEREGISVTVRGAVERALLLFEYGSTAEVNVVRFDVDTAIRDQTPVYVWDTERFGMEYQQPALYCANWNQQTLDRNDLVTGETAQWDWSELQQKHPGAEPGFFPLDANHILFEFTDFQEEGSDRSQEYLLDSRSGSYQPFSMRQSYTGYDIPILDTLAAEDGPLLLVMPDYYEAYVLDGTQNRLDLLAPQYALIRQEDFFASRPEYQLIHSQVFEPAE